MPAKKKLLAALAFFCFTLMITGPLLSRQVRSADPSKCDLAELRQYEISVSAGSWKRTHHIVSFPFPDSIAPGHYLMRSKVGDSITLQVDSHQRGWFLLKELDAGQTLTLYLSYPPGKPDNTEYYRVDCLEDPQRITIRNNRRPVAAYYHSENTPPDEVDERYKRGGYLHPVYSPSGTVLTSHLYPGYAHHSGIWSAWPRTRFQQRTPDFWNIHNNSGRVDAAGLEQIWEGKIQGGLRARQRFTDLSASPPVTALMEQWTVRVYHLPDAAGYHLFDLQLQQTAVPDSPVEIMGFHYGNLGFRGPADWNNRQHSTFLTSEGGNRDANATRARWVHFGGITEGKLAGIAILSHPDNHASPQYIRIHPDFAFFSYAAVPPTERMLLESGSAYTASYRFVTYDGDPDPDTLERLWRDFAYPPAVTAERR